MTLNTFFQNTLQGGTNNNEFNLLQELIVESIKQYGVDIYYMPRTLVAEDQLYGEDVLSIFNNAAPVEMYIKNVEGFEGEGDFLSKFGLEIRDQITFTVARKRFDQVQDESALTEVGYNILTEDGDELLIEDASGDSYNLALGRPREGDLLYFPLTEKIYEVKFVEHEAVFYQLGRLYTYDIRCEIFEYSSERLNTGVSGIDDIEDLLSTDQTFFEMLTENGDTIGTEDGGTIIIEDYRLEDQDKQANNEYFTTENRDQNIQNFSSENPFGEQIY